MAAEVIFVCEVCGNESINWMGRCPSCGNWNTYRQLRQTKTEEKRAKIGQITAEPQPVTEIKTTHFTRITSGIGEFDRVLGGGIIPGSVILLGGDPGIGKSTLIFQVADKISQRSTSQSKLAEQTSHESPVSSGRVLYVSGEESPEQIKLRAERLGILTDTLFLLAETDVNVVIEAVEKVEPKLMVIDSIQTMYDPDFPSTPGSIVQVRESALKLQQYAKTKHLSTILIGHVTKEGAVAGPRTLEHLVDVVLYLEGERYHGTRVLRGEKNRFGATDEIGVFTMGEQGMEEVANPSKIFLGDRKLNIPGSAVTCTIEGTRPFLIEVQALVTSTLFGYPQRKAQGFDLNRLQMIVAVLTRRADLRLATKDIFINVVGGVKLSEPAADLAVALAIASAEGNVALDRKLLALGELGLTGEIRPVSHLKKRLAEAKRLGLTRTVAAATIGEAIKATVGR
jgi:DNA repair protein RadA/Sms